MKTIIRFLAKISGVEKDIRSEERHYSAIQIIGASYWLTDHKKYGILYPLFQWVGKRFSYNHPINGDCLRNTIDLLNSDEYQKLYKDNEGWRDIKYNRILGILEIKEKTT